MRSWVVGRGGLLGASVDEACAARGTVHRPAVALPWSASADLHERLREESAAFFASIGDDPWMVLWCAGRGTLAATDDDMAADTAALDALLTGIEAACPAPARERGIVFHASSVGGLYAGSTSPPFTEFTEPAPTTPYGRAKLIQEQRLAAWAPRAGVRVLIGRNPRVFAAIEVACLDLIGKATGRPVHDLLGGAVRRRIPFAAYMFFKEEGDDDWGRALTPEEMVRQAELFHERYGMTCFKVKGGVLDPWEEVRTIKLLRERFGPRAGLRLDPNAAWSVETSLRVAELLRDTHIEYLEDPTVGI